MNKKELHNPKLSIMQMFLYSTNLQLLKIAKLKLPTSMKVRVHKIHEDNEKGELSYSLIVLWNL